MIEKESVIEALKEVIDPELGINIVDLGLVYEVDVTDNGTVSVTMTLTTPGCPLHDSIMSGVENRLQEIPEVTAVAVSLVWEPAWSPEKMSDQAKAQLGF